MSMVGILSSVSRVVARHTAHRFWHEVDEEKNRILDGDWTSSGSGLLHLQLPIAHAMDTHWWRRQPDRKSRNGPLR